MFPVHRTHDHDDEGKITRLAIIGGTALTCIISLRNQLRQIIDGSITERYSQRRLPERKVEKIRILHGDARALRALKTQVDHLDATTLAPDEKCLRVGRFICQLERKLNALTDVRHYWHRIISPHVDRQILSDESIVLYARLSSDERLLEWHDTHSPEPIEFPVAITFGRVPRFLRKKPNGSIDGRSDNDDNNGEYGPSL